MKFTAEKKVIEKTILPVSIVAQNKSSEASNDGIFIKAENDNVDFFCYDLEKGIKTNMEAFVASPGSIVSDSQLVPIIHSMPDGEITISSDDNFIITISCGETQVQILGKDSEKYPDMPQVKGDISFTLTQKQLRNLITKTCFSLSKDDSNPLLRGSYFEIKDNILTVSSIDGFRCAVRTEKSMTECPNVDITFILPGKAQTNLLKIMEDNDKEIKFELGTKHLIIYMDNLYYMIRLIEGDFPRYGRFIPEYTATAIVKRDEFIKSLERVAVINERTTTSAKFNFTDGVMKISCETNGGKISDALDIEFEGDDKEILFNHSFLLESLKCCDNEKVEIRIADNGRGTVICPTKEDESQDQGYLYLIMPIRSR